MCFARFPFPTTFNDRKGILLSFSLHLIFIVFLTLGEPAEAKLMLFEYESHS